MRFDPAIPVNISSVAGRSAGPTAGGYNASKWGVNGFSEALRREAHGDGIRVTVIEPGVVATELTHHIPDEETRTSYEARVGEIEPLAQPGWDVECASLSPEGCVIAYVVNEGGAGKVYLHWFRQLILGRPVSDDESSLWSSLS